LPGTRSHPCRSDILAVPASPPHRRHNFITVALGIWQFLRTIRVPPKGQHPHLSRVPSTVHVDRIERRHGIFTAFPALNEHQHQSFYLDVSCYMNFARTLSRPRVRRLLRIVIVGCTGQPCYQILDKVVLCTMACGRPLRLRTVTLTCCLASRQQRV
jgi:hypothetical protein